MCDIESYIVSYPVSSGHISLYLELLALVSIPALALGEACLENQNTSIMRTDSLRLHRSKVNTIIQGRANIEQ